MSSMEGFELELEAREGLDNNGQIWKCKECASVPPFSIWNCNPGHLAKVGDDDD